MTREKQTNNDDARHIIPRWAKVISTVDNYIEMVVCDYLYYTRMYECAYFNNGDRKTVYLSDDEIVKV